MFLTLALNIAAKQMTLCTSKLCQDFLVHFVLKVEGTNHPEMPILLQVVPKISIWICWVWPPPSKPVVNEVFSQDPLLSKCRPSSWWSRLHPGHGPHPMNMLILSSEVYSTWLPNPTTQPSSTQPGKWQVECLGANEENRHVFRILERRGDGVGRTRWSQPGGSWWPASWEVGLLEDRWWFQTCFIFTPILGEDEPILTIIFFQMGGLKPPTRKWWEWMKNARLSH